MGAKPSKAGGFDRADAFRKTQKKQFNEIRTKCNEISKNLKKFNGKDEAEYHLLRNDINAVQRFLQNISPELISQHRTLFDNYVGKCEEFHKILDGCYKGKAVQVEPQNVELKIVQLVEETTEDEEEMEEEITIENNKEEIMEGSKEGIKEGINEGIKDEIKEEKPKKQKRRKRKEHQRKETKEEISIKNLQAIREEMMPYRNEILTFKGHTNDRIYHFLEETFVRFIKKLERIDSHDHIQIKHDRTAAIAYAKESIQILEQIASANDNNNNNNNTETTYDRKSSYSFKEYHEDEKNFSPVDEVSKLDFKQNLNMLLNKQPGDRMSGLVKLKPISVYVDDDRISASSSSSSGSSYSIDAEGDYDARNAAFRVTPI